MSRDKRERDMASAAEDVVRACRPAFAGHPSAVQGAALADLLAIWLAGHPAELRDELLAGHLASVEELVPVNEKIIHARAAEPVGTPISQISGRPGHEGFGEFSRIASSWGYD